MNFNDNKAVKTAYEFGSYVDAAGKSWRRGMDGWFLDSADGRGVFLMRHHHMIAKIEEENPES